MSEPADEPIGRCLELGMAAGVHGALVQDDRELDEKIGELARHVGLAEEHGARVFLDQPAAVALGDEVLDAQVDDVMHRHGLTFARYEALVLLTFSRAGSLPLGKMGERLQVHPTSVTNTVDRLVAAGLVERRPNPRDGRGVLAALTSVRPGAWA